MATASGTVKVNYRAFSLIDTGVPDDSLPPPPPEPGFSFLAGYLGIVTINTGVICAPLAITVETLESQPADPDLGAWDGVEETAFESVTGEVVVCDGDYVPEADQFPDSVTSSGPGTYRVRAHMRSRFANYDSIVDESAETYLIQAWPTTKDDTTPRILKESPEDPY